MISLNEITDLLSFFNNIDIPMIIKKFQNHLS